MNDDPLLFPIEDHIDDAVVLDEQTSLISTIIDPLRDGIDIPEKQVDNPKIDFDSQITEVTYKPVNTVIVPDASEEVIEKRKPNSKTFRNNDGSFSVVLSRSTLHFKRGNDWLETNLLIRDVNGRKVVTNARYKIELFTDRIGYRYIDENNKTFTIELKQIEGIDVDYTNLISRVDSNQIFYDGLIDGLHHKILLLSEKPEIYTKIDDETVPRSFTWLVTGVDKFDFTSKGGDSNQDLLELNVEENIIDNNSFTYTETWTGNVSRIISKKTRQKGLFSDPVYPVIIDPTVTISTTANIDDGHGNSNFVGPVNTGGNWYQGYPVAGMFTLSPPVTSIGLYPGFRFRSVNVPAGATITSAILKIKSSSSGSFGTNTAVKVFADKVANASLWSNTSRPKQITKTTASTSFTPSATNNAVNSIDVTNQIGEVVGLGGWASNNAIRLAGLSIARAVSWQQHFIDYSTSPANAAQLVITYTTGGGGGSPVGEEYTILFN